MEPVPKSSYYQSDRWDVKAWVEVIALEYEELIRAYPFNNAFKALTGRGSIRLLDIGCGTGIFPSFLDPVLGSSIRISCDLLDLAEESLQEAGRVLRGLKHFDVNRVYHGMIEEIPALFAHAENTYDVIWAVHSFSTVELAKMPAVFRHILKMLRPGGYFFLYQFGTGSTYQVLHSYYRQQQPPGARSRPFMDFEDSRRILAEIGVGYELYELTFAHEIDDRRADLLEKYLRKCVLDEEINPFELFEPILGRFHDAQSRSYVFPQQLNFVEVRK